MHGCINGPRNIAIGILIGPSGPNIAIGILVISGPRNIAIGILAHFMAIILMP